jgi:hypothetical protein
LLVARLAAMADSLNDTTEALREIAQDAGDCWVTQWHAGVALLGQAALSAWLWPAPAFGRTTGDPPAFLLALGLWLVFAWRGETALTQAAPPC